MNASTIKTLCTRTALLAFGWLAFNCNAEVFYGGQTRGLPGDAVELSINARAGTSLDGLDIVPELIPVAGVLEFVSLTPTSEYTDDGFGLCTDTACSFFYLPAKDFAVDTLLATLRFNINPGAPVGPVAFDAGVVVGEDPLPIPDGAGFEVLAIPEPSSVALLLLGLVGMAGVVRRGRGMGSVVLRLR